MKAIITTIFVFCAITLFAQNPPDFIIENGNKYVRIKTQADLAKIKSIKVEKVVKKVSVDINAPGSIIIEGAVIHLALKGKKVKGTGGDKGCGGSGFSCKASAELAISVTPTGGPGNSNPGPPEFKKAVVKEFGNEVPQDGKFMFYSKTADELIIRQF